MISAKNKRGRAVDGQEGQGPLLASGAGPAGPLQPAELRPAAPGPRHLCPGQGEGGGDRQGKKRTDGAAGRAGEKGRFVPQKCEGSRMASPGPSISLLRRRGWGRADSGEGSGARTGGPESRGTPSPFPGLPTPQPAPCPHLMLTSFATRKVCLEARTRGKGRGESEGCWGGGCILINDKI